MSYNYTLANARIKASSLVADAIRRCRADGRLHIAKSPPCHIKKTRHGGADFMCPAALALCANQDLEPAAAAQCIVSYIDAPNEVFSAVYAHNGFINFKIADTWFYNALDIYDVPAPVPPCQKQPARVSVLRETAPIEYTVARADALLCRTLDDAALPSGLSDTAHALCFSLLSLQDRYADKPSALYDALREVCEKFRAWYIQDKPACARVLPPIHRRMLRASRHALSSGLESLGLTDS